MSIFSNKKSVNLSEEHRKKKIRKINAKIKNITENSRLHYIQSHTIAFEETHEIIFYYLSFLEG